MSSSPTNSDPTARRCSWLDSRGGTSRVCAPTTGPKTRTSRCDDGSARCRASNRPLPLNVLLPSTLPSTTSSTSSAARQPDEPAAPLLAVQCLAQGLCAHIRQRRLDFFHAKVQLAGAFGCVENSRQGASGGHGLIHSRNVSFSVIYREPIGIQ